MQECIVKVDYKVIGGDDYRYYDEKTHKEVHAHAPGSWVAEVMKLRVEHPRSFTFALEMMEIESELPHVDVVSASDLESFCDNNGIPFKFVRDYIQRDNALHVEGITSWILP